MMKALQAYNQDDLNNLASKAKVVTMQNNKKDNVDYTLTKKSVVSISNNFVGIQNEFNKIAANITGIKALQNKVMNDRSIPSNDNTPVASRIIGADQFEDNIAGLGEYFETLAKLLKKLNLKTPDTTQPETDGGDIDIDIDRKRGRRSRRTRARGRGRLRGRGLAGKALGIFGVGLDVTDRLSSGEDVAEAAVGVAGGVAGGIGGAQAGAALGALGGPAALVTVPLGGLIGGALGYLAGGFIADKAYDAVAEPSTQRVPASKPAIPVQRSSVDRRLENAVKTASAAPAVRQPSEISNNSYSSRFASYLSDVFANVKGYVGGMAGAAISAAAGLVGGYSPVGPGAGSTENALIAMQFFMSPEGGGWTREQAAGIVGNLQGESSANINPNAIGDNGDAYGIAQWNQKASPDRVSNFSRVIGTDLRSSNLQQQLRFVAWELQNTEAVAGNRLRNSRDVQSATVAMSYYERYRGYREGLGSAETVRRISNAQALLVAPPQMTGGQFVNPVPSGRITSLFGASRDGGARRHMGVDIAGVPIGTPVGAAAAGTVTLVGSSGAAGGNRVRVVHNDNLFTNYEHLSSFSVTPGQQVVAGQIIGRVGNTGQGTGPHLHFSVWVNGREVDPMPYLNAAPAAAASPAGTPTRASLMQNPNVAAQYFDALSPNRRRGSGSLVLLPSAAPAQSTITFPYRFGQTPPRQPNANPRGAYPAYHGQ